MESRNEFLIIIVFFTWTTLCFLLAGQQCTGLKLGLKGTIPVTVTAKQSKYLMHVIRVYVWNDLDCTVFSDFSKP